MPYILRSMLASALLLGGVSGAAPAPYFTPAGLDLSARDAGTRPQDDFYQYVNGGWLARATIPPGQASLSIGSELDERVRTELHRLLEEHSAAGSGGTAAQTKVGAFYSAFIDQSRLDALAAGPLSADLADIRAVRTKAELAQRMGRSQYDFGGSLFALGIDVDIGNPSQYAIYLGQAGLGMPDRDYYLAAGFHVTRSAYRAYIERLLTLVDWPDPGSTASAVFALEAKFAEASWSRAAQTDLRRLYNPLGPEQLDKLAPGFDWKAYLAAAGLGDRTRIVVAEYSAIPKLAALYDEAPLDTLKAWQAFLLADSAAAYLSHDFQQARFEFRQRALLGRREPAPRWRQAVEALSPSSCADLRECAGAMRWALGEVFVAQNFPPEAKARAERMAANVIGALRSRLEKNEWMSGPTRAAAVKKLATYTIKVGYPDHGRDLSALEVRPDDLIGNVRRAARAEWEFQLSRSRGPVDRTAWQITPQTVDAYTGQLRDVVFPAAILQPPLFDPAADDAVNYGSTATSIARELARGFFDEGRLIDAEGGRRDGWSAQDVEEFRARATALGAQYAAFEPLPGLHIDPQQTMAENVADLCGLLVAFDAYHASLNGRPAPVIDGLSGDQRFFIAYAQSWRGLVSDEAIRDQVRAGTESYRKFRVLGPLRNVDAWYAAFKVREGDRMYLAPGDRVRLW